MSMDSSDDPTVTFEHFQEGREESGDLAKAVGVAPWRDAPVSGFQREQLGAPSIRPPTAWTSRASPTSARRATILFAPHRERMASLR
jgi:hypothetical protein